MTCKFQPRTTKLSLLFKKKRLKKSEDRVINNHLLRIIFLMKKQIKVAVAKRKKNTITSNLMKLNAANICYSVRA